MTKTFDDIREFTYIGNTVTVDGVDMLINTKLPAKSSQTDVELHAVQWHRYHPMIEETAIGMITVDTIQYQYALNEWNAAKELIDNPVYTAEQLKEIELSNWKAARSLSVSRIEVSHNEVVYQGDEESQTRMTRAVTALPDDEMTMSWIAKDNTVHNLTRVDLKAILFAAGMQQASIWDEGRPS